MLLSRLLYVSAAARAYDEDDLIALLRQSRQRNLEDNITGLLLYGNERFVQTIEGPPGAVDALRARLRRDTRHHSYRELFLQEAKTRAYKDWSMAFRHVMPEEMLGFTPLGELLQAADRGAATDLPNAAAIFDGFVRDRDARHGAVDSL
ncbi:BLUF domain-containing protein [Roseiterribacter gracilis]